ncbi:unnamed protein product [Caenorhabditis brenneri]
MTKFWPWVLFLAYLSYGLPSVTLYLITFIIILRNRKTFESSFFKLYIYDGLLNLLTYFNNWFKTRAAAISDDGYFMGQFYKTVGEYPIVMMISMFLNFHMAYVQYATTTLISLNRLSAMINSNRYEPRWKKWMGFGILLIFLFPSLNTHVVFWYKVEMVYSNESYSMTTEMPINSVFIYCIPFMILCAGASVVSNIFSISLVRGLSSTKKHKADTNFMVYTCVTCIAQVFGTTLSCIRAVFVGSVVAAACTHIIPFMSDTLSLVQPWLLSVFSQQMNSKILCRKPATASKLFTRSAI